MEHTAEQHSVFFYSQLPVDIQDLLSHRDDVEITFDYDGRAEGCYSRFSVYANAFDKRHLDMLFRYSPSSSHPDYTGVMFSKRKQKLWVEIEIELS